MRTMLLIATAAALGIDPAHSALNRSDERPRVALQSDEREVSFAVEGMTCGRCATTLAAGLLQVVGVLEARVSHDERRATVRYDARRVTVEQLIAAIVDLGYRAQVESEG